MLEDYKKYIPHLISFLFLLNGILVFLLKNSPGVILFGFLVIICGMAILGESLYNIVKSREEDVPINPVITYPLLVIFGVFYNPCFSLRYFEGDQDYKKKNIIFLAITIVLSIILLILFINRGNNKLKKEVSTPNNSASMMIPDGYGVDYSGAGDLAYSDGDHYIRLTTINESDDKAYYEDQKSFLKKKLTDYNIIADDTDTVKDKTIRKFIIEGKIGNETYVNVIATIKSSDSQDKFVSVHQYCFESSYDSYKKTINKIIENVEIN